MYKHLPQGGTNPVLLSWMKSSRALGHSNKGFILNEDGFRGRYSILEAGLSQCLPESCNEWNGPSFKWWDTGLKEGLHICISPEESRCWMLLLFRPQACKSGNVLTVSIQPTYLESFYFINEKLSLTSLVLVKKSSLEDSDNCLSQC